MLLKEKTAADERASAKGKIMYIIQAMLEYLVSILVASSFLATLTGAIGMSDSLTGIISSIISLGCLFQLLSVPIHPKNPKRFITVFSIINQILFMLLYMIPVINVDKEVKVLIFAAAIILAYIIYNIAHPKKISWLMSLVDNGSRGKFTADKEIISLIFGMAFTWGMGALVDSFRDRGNIKTAFLLCALTIFLLTVLHTVVMILTPAQNEAMPKIEKNPKNSTLKALKNKKVIKVAGMFVLWNIASYSAIPFYGTYQINELSFSLKLVSVLGIVGSIARVAASRVLGAYADRRSFAVMIRLCFCIMAIGFLCCSFAVPSNGFIMFLIYYICHGIALGGINSALINLVFDYVPVSERADALALSQAVAGLSGFFSTLVFSMLVSRIQQNGNRLFDFPLYAQQAVSFIAFAVTLLAALYATLVLIPRRKRK